MTGAREYYSRQNVCLTADVYMQRKRAFSQVLAVLVYMSFYMYIAIGWVGALFVLQNCMTTEYVIYNLFPINNYDMCQTSE